MNPDHQTHDEVYATRMGRLRSLRAEKLANIFGDERSDISPAIQNRKQREAVENHLRAMAELQAERAFRETETTHNHDFLVSHLRGKIDMPIPPPRGRSV
jgi:hypothetical protein